MVVRDCCHYLRRLFPERWSHGIHAAYYWNLRLFLSHVNFRHVTLISLTSPVDVLDDIVVVVALEDRIQYIIFLYLQVLLLHLRSWKCGLNLGLNLINRLLATQHSVIASHHSRRLSHHYHIFFIVSKLACTHAHHFIAHLLEELLSLLTHQHGASLDFLNGYNHVI